MFGVLFDVIIDYKNVEKLSEACGQYISWVLTCVKHLCPLDTDEWTEECMCLYLFQT